MRKNPVLFGYLHKEVKNILNRYIMKMNNIIFFCFFIRYQYCRFCIYNIVYFTFCPYIMTEVILPHTNSKVSLSTKKKKPQKFYTNKISKVKNFLRKNF